MAAQGLECGEEWHKTFTVQSHLSRINLLSAAADTPSGKCAKMHCLRGNIAYMIKMINHLSCSLIMLCEKLLSRLLVMGSKQELELANVTFPFQFVPSFVLEIIHSLKSHDKSKQWLFTMSLL